VFEFLPSGRDIETGHKQTPIPSFKREATRGTCAGCHLVFIIKNVPGSKVTGRVTRSQVPLVVGVRIPDTLFVHLEDNSYEVVVNSTTLHE
jgi:hypothetical protein